MKYLPLGIIASILTAWVWVNYDNSEVIQPIQIYGKVEGLQGKLVLNIDNYHLNLGELDRFSFIAYPTASEQLSIQVSAQPKNQHCQLVNLSEHTNKVQVQVDCQDIKLATAIDNSSPL